MLAGLPTKFGAYVVHVKLATGGMGEVYLATRAGAARGTPPLVLKILLPEYSGDATFVNMFHDEARIGMRLSHPNVAAVHDIGRVAEDHYLVLEYVHGVDLRQLQHRMRLRREGFPTETVLRIGLECLQALDHAHRAKDERGRPLNLVHRDLSPENIMISFDGDVKVLDFGIARAEGRAVVTRAGHVKGKTGYMAPEQAMGEKVDNRTDLYALALCMLELISGERRFPIDGDKFEEVRMARTWTPQPPSTWDKTITPAIDAVMLKALALDRADRYQNADDFLRDLNKALREYKATRRERVEQLPELLLRHFPDRAEPFLHFDEDTGEKLLQVVGMADSVKASATDEGVELVLPSDGGEPPTAPIVAPVTAKPKATSPSRPSVSRPVPLFEDVASDPTMRVVNPDAGAGPTARNPRANQPDAGDGATTRNRVGAAQRGPQAGSGAGALFLPAIVLVCALIALAVWAMRK